MDGDSRELSDSSWFRPDELSSYAEFLTGNHSQDQRNFMTLMEMIGEMITEKEYRTLLRRMVATILRLNEAERGILLLKPSDKKQDQSGDERYVVRVALDENGEDLGGTPPYAGSVIRSVIKTGRPIIERVDSSHKTLDLSGSVAALRLRQIMCAPLRAGGEILGVIYIDSRLVGKPHTREDLLLFNAQAGLLAMAVQNHRLIKETIASREKTHEMKTARSIQRRLLPPSPFAHAGAQLAGISNASSDVGGDYFDFIRIDAHQTAIVVGDVSGHGLGPALIMSNTRAYIRSLLMMRGQIDGLYGVLNRALCEDLTDGMFVALFVAVYDQRDGHLRYQNAGQIPPVVYSPARDELTEIETTSTALGIVPDQSAGPARTLRMQPGDYFICVTDGVTEARDARKRFFGTEAVSETLRRMAREGAAPEAIVRSLREQVDRHLGATASSDDITIVAGRF
ncbi:MAG: GAF domain-containing SpoIIE family protein phosphatase [Planctomycetota bacterium]